MFDVGFWEVSLIAIVALVIVGPERLPSLVNEAGKWAGRARGTIRDLKYDLQRQAEIEQLSELGKDFKNATDSINPHGLKKNFRDLVDDAESKAQAEINEVIPGEIENDAQQNLANAGLDDTAAEVASPDTSKIENEKTTHPS